MAIKSTKRKKIRFHSLRGQVVRRFFLAFILSLIVFGIGAIIIYIATSDGIEAELYADYVKEELQEEIDDINDVGSWDGWEQMNPEWRVDVYDEDANLVYTNGVYMIMSSFWINANRDLEDLDGYLVINAITSEKTENFIDLWRFASWLIFMLIFGLLFRKIQRYTYEISDGISILAGGEMNHRIPIKSKNELAMIASNINGMAEALNTRTAEKQKSDKERDDMITNLAHDIRTPITVLEGYLSMLIDNDDIPDEKKKEYLQISLNKCHELSSRADNIFEFVRLHNKKEQLKPKTVGAKQYINEKFEETAMILAREGFTFKVDIQLNEDSSLYIDIDLVQRVFDNLLSNIIKYADSGYPIELKAYENDGYIFAAIKNKSKGKIMLETDRMFERTVSGDESRSKKSEGLGLAICKLIMEMQNGGVSAEAENDFIEFELKFLN